jgi:hypothetical protein
MKKIREVVNGVCAKKYRCEFGCGQDSTEVEISETPYGTYVCGDIDCWNNFCLEFWSPLEVVEEEYECCDDCEEEIDECYCESEEE